jgi:hypothetical protein
LSVEELIAIDIFGRFFVVKMSSLCLLLRSAKEEKMCKKREQKLILEFFLKLMLNFIEQFVSLFAETEFWLNENCINLSGLIRSWMTTAVNFESLLFSLN